MLVGVERELSKTVVVVVVEVVVKGRFILSVGKWERREIFLPKFHWRRHKRVGIFAQMKNTCAQNGG